jgi:hypothetical protein
MGDKQNRPFQLSFPTKCGAIAYNLGNLWRLVLPKEIEGWSLTSLQQRLAKTGGRWIKLEIPVEWKRLGV